MRCARTGGLFEIFREQAFRSDLKRFAVDRLLIYDITRRLSVPRTGEFLISGTRNKMLFPKQIYYFEPNGKSVRLKIKTNLRNYFGEQRYHVVEPPLIDLYSGKNAEFLSDPQNINIPLPTDFIFTIEWEAPQANTYGKLGIMVGELQIPEVS